MYTVKQLEEKTGLNRQTVEKCVKLMLALEDYFKSYEFRIEKADNKTIVFSDSRIPFSELPKDVQKVVLEKEYPGINLERIL